jgi:hypothetical protein
MTVPEDFLSRSTESLFNPLTSNPHGPEGWADYLKGRYLFVADAL